MTLNDHERIVELESALLTIRGYCLGNGPRKDRKRWCAVNDLVGWVLYRDNGDEKWVRRFREGDGQ